METRSAYRRRNTITLRLQKRLALAVFAGVAAGISILALLPGSRLERAPAGSQDLPALARPLTLTTAETRNKPRRIYPYSIVPGGVGDRGELLHMVKSDDVVKRHYAGIALDKMKVETVAKPRAVYVSYRKGDQVYWTAKRVTLREGETVLTDGQNQIRGRCGNRISDQPRLPVEPKGPTETELDSSTEDDMVDTSYNAAIASGGERYPLSTFPTGTGESSGGGGQTSEPFPTPVATPNIPLFPGVNGGTETPPANTVTPVPTPPGTPTTPVTPVTPVTPNTPTTPTTPETPVTPVTPVTPNTPVTPGTPDTPGVPPETPLPPDTPLPPLPWPPELPPANPPTTDQPPPNDVPEPGTLWLGGIGLAALLLRRRRR